VASELQAVIILDTNVLSELSRARPSSDVTAWARAQDPKAIFTTAVCEAELLYGIALLPDGKRRAELARAIATMLGVVLAGRVLPFDRAAAQFYAELAAYRRRHGKSAGMADLQIAAVALARGATAIATRNVDHFDGCDVLIVNPWQDN
jgi:predicted nucleic acid-binding protein